MIKKSLLMLFTFLILASYIVSAEEKAAYILKNPGVPVQKYINILEDMGFTVDLIDDNNLPSVNFSQYSLQLIDKGFLNNIGYIPVNEMPSLILNEYHMDDFHWSRSTGLISSVNQAYINDPNYFISKDFPGITNIYTGYRPANFLYKGYRSPYLKVVASLTIDHQDAFIATAKPGTILRDGFVSNSKGVYFGIDEYNYWTNYSEIMFRNSVLWLTTDLIPPVIFNVAVSEITNQSAKITWNTDKNSNSSVLYGKDLSLNLIKTNASLVQNHEILLNNLNQLTTYYYRAKSCNEDGYCSNSSIYNFSTLELTPPYLISTSILNLTNSSANISIVTNENANLTVFYGINQNSLTNKIGKSTFSTISNIFINNLNENISYFYKIKMCDIYANCANSSIYNFTTLDFTPPNAPRNLILEVNNSNNNIKVKWEAPNGESVAKYNVYISNSTMPDLTNFNFKSPNASITLTEYTDNTASTIAKRYYVVRAQDAAGNEEKNTNIVGKFDLDLNIGYNLISFPLIPFDGSINKVMHQNESYKPISEIKKYDNINKEFKTITYNTITNEWNTIANFNKLAPLESYFFLSDQNVDFTIVGNVSSQITLNLVEGLNLVGLTLIETKTIEETITQTPADYDVTEIASRNNDGSYNIATYYEANGWFNEFNIEPATGYWLKANKDFNLVIE